METEGLPVVVGDSQQQLKASAMEAELKPAQIKSNKPLEERQQDFKAMLLERGVSYFTSLVCLV